MVTEAGVNLSDMQVKTGSCNVMILFISVGLFVFD